MNLLNSVLFCKNSLAALLSFGSMRFSVGFNSTFWPFLIFEDNVDFSSRFLTTIFENVSAGKGTRSSTKRFTIFFGLII